MDDFVMVEPNEKKADEKNQDSLINTILEKLKKSCKLCKVKKSADEFTNSQYKKSRDAVCMTCQRKCSRCRQMKPYTHFSSNQLKKKKKKCRNCAHQSNVVYQVRKLLRENGLIML